MQRFLMESGRFALAVAILGGTAPVLAQAQDDPAGTSVQVAEQEQPPVLAGDALPASSAPRTYFPSDFADTAPRNALDLVEQVPGFNVQGGGNFNGGGGGRGFGEASGNLLINGDRISSKSTSVRDELQRIPVANVVRIEIVDGATMEIPGLSGQVANVIVESGGLTGQFNWRPQISTGPAPIGFTQGRVSVRGTESGVDYSIALDVGGFIRGSDGSAIFTDSFGIDERFNVQSAQFRRPGISANFAFDVAQDVRANINLSGGLVAFRAKEREERVAASPFPAFVQQFRSSNDEIEYEIGGDIEFPAGPGRLKLIALESFKHQKFSTQSLTDEGILATSGSRFQRIGDEGERIARAEYSWGMFGGDWQLSGEAAFNRLDNVGSLFGYDPVTDDFFEIPFPSGVGGVREERYESILSFGRSLTDNLSLQITAGGEYSKISQTGSNALSRTFQRPKGSVSLAWAAGSGLDISLEVARRVGQLNFTNFLASVNITEENSSAGNNQLRPQQSWESELEISKSFGEWGSVTLRLFDQRIDDFLTIVPLVGGGEASGNIESAHRYGFRLNGRLELEQLGLRGAQLDVRIEGEESSLLDPVTLVGRRFDGFNPFEIRLDFRHDIPETDWAWGLEFRDTQQAKRFRVAEVTLDHNISTFGAVYVEHKDILGLTARVRVGNIFNGNNVLQRTIYDGPRDSSPVLFTEDRRLAIGQVFNLTISGSF